MGEIKQIKFFFPKTNDKGQIKITVWVKRDIQIPDDSTIWVNTLGLLGEKYVEIMPGVNYSHCLLPNETMAGVDPIPMHEVFRIGKNIADIVNESITRMKNKEGTLGKLLYDDTIYNELEAFMVDIRKHPWKLFYKGKE